MLKVTQAENTMKAFKKTKQNRKVHEWGTKGSRSKCFRLCHFKAFTQSGFCSATNELYALQSTTLRERLARLRSWITNSLSTLVKCWRFTLLFLACYSALLCVCFKLSERQGSPAQEVFISDTFVTCRHPGEGTGQRVVDVCGLERVIH